MAIYIPAALTEELAVSIDTFTRADITDARVIADDIAWIAINAAETALTFANSYTNAMTGDVRSDLTDSLNAASDYLSDDIHLLRQYVIDEMLPALEDVAAASGEIDEEIGEEIVKAYDSIADAHVTLGDVVELAITKAADFVTESNTQVGTWINEQFEGALAVVNSTIDHITDAMQGYIDAAVDILIPAEMQAWLSTIGDVLESKAVHKVLELSGDIFKKRFTDALTIDEDELQKWIKKGSEYMQGIAMQSAQTEEGV